MAVTVNAASLVLKDKDGNTAVVRGLSDNDITKIEQARTDVAKIVDATSHELIMGTTTVPGAAQLATDTDITNEATDKVVTAAQLAAVKGDLAKVYKYKGTVATYSALPTSDVAEGDVYNVEAATTIDGHEYPAGTNFAATFSGDPATLAWDPLGGDASTYARKAADNVYTGENDFTGGTVTVADAETDSAESSYDAKAAANVGVVASMLEGAIDDIVHYSATKPDADDVDANTATFYPAEDLLA